METETPTAAERSSAVSSTVEDNAPSTVLSLRQRAAQTIILRRNARRNFRDWCLLLGYSPAKHHELVIRKCQEVTDSPTSRFVIILMPPGSAKSTYTSASFPPWFLGRKPGCSILACSYSMDLAENFGRRCRNTVQEYGDVLGYKLKSDSKSAGAWDTTTGGRYFCAGVGSGIAGHRSDLGLIDDPIGSQEDADSKLTRDKQWDWFLGDFFTRLKPNASVIIIANRRHEDDLVGRLLSPETKGSPVPADRWEVIRLPFFAEDDDPLGREIAVDEETKIASRLWPDWFTPDMARSVMNMPPRILAGLYQQRPAPEDGDYFKRENLLGYTREELDAQMSRGGFRNYITADFAISEEASADRTAIIPAGVDHEGTLWIYPDIFWKRSGPRETVSALLNMMERRKPELTIAEKGHISKSLGPYIELQKRERLIFGHIEEVTPTRAKDVRARAFQGLTEMHKVRFPKFADWWEKAEHEMLTFPGGKNDDFVDALAHLGGYVHNMLRSRLPKAADRETQGSPMLTLKYLRAADRRAANSKLPRYQGR